MSEETGYTIDIDEIAERIAAILRRCDAEGITGWGIGNPAPDLFEATEVGAPSGCTSQTCNHYSHDPAAPTVRLTPRAGISLRALGGWEDHDYSAVTTADGTRFFCETRDRGFYDRIREITFGDLPDYAWLALINNEPAEAAR